LGRGDEQVEVATRVNDGGLVRLVAPDDGAVLLERGYGDGLVVQHGREFSGRQFRKGLPIAFGFLGITFENGVCAKNHTTPISQQGANNSRVYPYKNL
jgi:hypothetical protein